MSRSPVGGWVTGDNGSLAVSGVGWGDAFVLLSLRRNRGPQGHTARRRKSRCQPGQMPLLREGFSTSGITFCAPRPSTSQTSEDKAGVAGRPVRSPAKPWRAAPNMASLVNITQQHGPGYLGNPVLPGAGPGPGAAELQATPTRASARGPAGPPTSPRAAAPGLGAVQCGGHWPRGARGAGRGCNHPSHPCACPPVGAEVDRRGL